MPDPRDPSRSPRARRAAAVVYCQVDGEARYLFVSSSSSPDRFVLPGGWADAGESNAAAAARETREEAGFDVAIVEPLGTFWHVKSSGRRRLTEAFLAEPVGACEPLEDRHTRWLSAADLADDSAGVPKPIRRAVLRAHRALAHAAAV